MGTYIRSIFLSIFTNTLITRGQSDQLYEQLLSRCLHDDSVATVDVLLL